MSTKALGFLVGGLFVFLIGGIFSALVISGYATSGTATGIGSFSQAKTLNDNQPTFWYIGLTMLGLGSMIGGAFGIAGKGPLK